jgi:N-methylhydantoinase A/oxoprolinase/acetone carboxylase beta subunit
VEDTIPESPGRARAEIKSKGKRKAFFERKGQLAEMDTDIFDGNSLGAGDFLIGPSIVERYGDAIVIPPGYKGEVDALGTISLTGIN